jgi:hypothetical protein
VQFLYESNDWKPANDATIGFDVGGAEKTLAGGFGHLRGLGRRFPEWVQKPAYVLYLRH